MSKQEKHWNEAWLKRARLTNYKSIRDMEVEFKPGLNIIIGRNGSGKTNLMEYLANILRPDLFSTPEGGEVEFSCVLRGKEYEYKLVPEFENYPNEEEQTFSTGPIFKREKRLAGSHWEPMADMMVNPISGVEVRTLFLGYSFPEDLDFLSREGVFSFMPRRMLRETAFKSNQKRKSSILFSERIENQLLALESRSNLELNDLLAEGVESILIKKKRKFALEVKKSLHRTLEIVEKGIANFTPIKKVRLIKDLPSVHINRRRNSIDVSDLKIEFQVEGEWLTFDKLSDGTRRLFVLTTSVLLPVQDLFMPDNPTFKNLFKTETGTFPKIILLEEPEMGIHPHQLFELMTFIKEQSRFMQIIVTTHSPVVLDVLDLDEMDRVFSCQYSPEHGTRVLPMGPAELKVIEVFLEENLKISDAWLHSPNFEPHAG